MCHVLSLTLFVFLTVTLMACSQTTDEPDSAAGIAVPELPTDTPTPVPPTTMPRPTETPSPTAASTLGGD